MILNYICLWATLQAGGLLSRELMAVLLKKGDFLPLLIKPLPETQDHYRYYGGTHE